MTRNEFNKLIDSINYCCEVNIEHRDAQICAADNMLIAAVKSMNLHKTARSKYVVIMGQEERKGTSMHINTRFNNSHYRNVLMVKTLEYYEEYIRILREAYPNREVPEIYGYLDE